MFAFGLVCSSFVSVSRGSTHRHYFLPLGDPSSKSVELGNLLCSRNQGSPEFQIYNVSCLALRIQTNWMHGHRTPEFPNKGMGS